MNDELLARQLAARLEAADAPLPAQVGSQLARARRAAMSRMRPPAILATTAGPLLQTPAPRLGGLASGILLLAVLVALYAWQRSAWTNGGMDELELLADDVPPSAYLDRGFQQWLSGSLGR